MRARVAPSCRNCTHFRNDPAFLEKIFKGLSALSSAWGSVRAEDGMCQRHDRYLSANAFCADFAPFIVPLYSAAEAQRTVPGMAVPENGVQAIEQEHGHDEPF